MNLLPDRVMLRWVREAPDEEAHPTTGGVADGLRTVGDRRPVGEDCTTSPRVATPQGWTRSSLAGRPCPLRGGPLGAAHPRRWEDDGTWLKLWRAFLAELDGRHRLNWSEAFIDGSFAPAKKGGSPSARPSGGKARSGWWWQTARVFLWEAPWPRPPLRKSRSSTRRSTRLRSRAPAPAGRARSPRA